jgi:hypothetical protein
VRRIAVAGETKKPESIASIAAFRRRYLPSRASETSESETESNGIAGKVLAEQFIQGFTQRLSTAGNRSRSQRRR